MDPFVPPHFPGLLSTSWLSFSLTFEGFSAFIPTLDASQGSIH